MGAGTIISIIGVSTGLLTAIITLLLNWFRFRKKDRADIFKVYADTEKSIAESIKIKNEAEIAIAQAWMSIAKQMESDLKETRILLKQCQEYQKSQNH